MEKSRNIPTELEMGFGVSTNIKMKAIDMLNEELEHTILDNILLEWEQDEDYEMVEGVRKNIQDDDRLGLEVGTGDGVDECIKTITCEGNCSSN